MSEQLSLFPIELSTGNVQKSSGQDIPIASWDKLPSCARGQHRAEWFTIGAKVRYLGKRSELHESDRGTVTRIDLFLGGKLLINVQIGKYIFALSPSSLEVLND